MLEPWGSVWAPWGDVVCGADAGGMRDAVSLLRKNPAYTVYQSPSTLDPMWTCLAYDAGPSDTEITRRA
jgi:hypothetical protein